jgi:hypothetical protein
MSYVEWRATVLHLLGHRIKQTEAKDALEMASLLGPEAKQWYDANKSPNEFVAHLEQRRMYL